MTKQFYYIALAVIMTGLLFIVPQMLKVRIAALRWLRLNWFADLHQNNFKVFVIAVRAVMAVIIIILLYLGLSG